MKGRSLSQKLIYPMMGLLLTLSNSIFPLFSIRTATASNYCQLSPQAIAQKETLLKTALKGDRQAQQTYQNLIQKHAIELRRCRQQTWPQEQAIWLRLYPCDVRPGSIDAVLDRIVSKGYNTVYIETFANSQVLLPPADNPTPWDTVVRTPGVENVDLLAKTIKKGRERGLKMYAWLFTLNFGYAYAQRSDRQQVLARNGKGQDSTTYVHDGAQAFVDPYNRQAQTDYYRLLEAVLKRRPDGVLFDYVRYPRGTGTHSVAGKIKDLWIYSPASLQVLYDRAMNNKGRDLIHRYVTKGYLTLNDLKEVDRLYPNETVPLWQGRTIPETAFDQPLNVRYQRIKDEIWYLTVAHAAQGVINFVSFAESVVKRYGIQAGAVFFPDGNRLVGEKGFDSRLQAWDQFSASLEFHPMAYGLCKDANCIVEQVKRVFQMASPQTKITPAIAGSWGKAEANRPALETQMNAIRTAFPQLKSISHFAFSWQEPEFNQTRRSCK